MRQFCGEALEMESTVPEPQPVAPVAEVAREPAATAADDVLLADCRAPPLSSRLALATRIDFFTSF